MAKKTKQTKQIIQASSPAQPELQKKLRKNERTLRKRLQEAREVQAEALERVKRALAQLEKRTVQTQSLEDRLTFVQQQLGISQTPQLSPIQIAQTLSISTDEATQTAEPQPETMQILITEERVSPEEVVLMEWLAHPLPADVEVELPETLAAELDISGQIGETTETAETGEAEEVDEAGKQASEDVDMHDENALSGDTLVISPDDASVLAKAARAVAETAEHAARIAIERAVAIATRLEQVGSGRHLIQELVQTQSEADRASAIAQQAQRAAEEAERLAAESAIQAPASPETESEMQTSASPEPETPVSINEEAVQEETTEELILSTLEEMTQEETIPEELIREEVSQEEQEAISNLGEITQETVSSAEVLQEVDLPLPVIAGDMGEAEDIEDIKDMETIEDIEGIEDIDDIEEEEAMVEAITAKLIADAAAAAAAEAEALAEASSARTREARRLAAEADRALDDVYAAFLNGSIPEEEAQARLNQTEHQATRAHAMLADAEAAEEEALNAARNAEAEAEVAEGMAFASNDIAENQLEADIAFTLTGENVSSNNGGYADDKGNASNANNTNDINNVSDTDTTTKIRKIYPRQPM